MSKRNIILIAIVLVVIAIFALVFMSLSSPANKGGSGATGGTNFLSNFFPFGKNNGANTNNNGTTPVNVSGYVPPGGGMIPKELLTKVSSMPVAGYGIFAKERFTNLSSTGSSQTANSIAIDTSTASSTPAMPATPTPPATEFVTALRYVERATGNIFETFSDNINEVKFTTTVIPQAYDAYFGAGANSVVMRYLKDGENTIESFAGTLPKEVFGGDTVSGPSDITGAFLPENITSISLSPDSSSIFYLYNTGDAVIGTTATPSGDNKIQIFNSPFTEWQSQWPNSRMITFTTKPSYGTPGYMYALDPNLKSMTKVLSGINGLTTLTSPSGKLILYNNNNLSMRIYNTDTEDSVSVGIKTMPEKCVWANDSTILYCAVPKSVSGSNFPDAWYQGEVSFSDDIWKINVENGNATDIADPTAFSGGEEIDGIKLSLDPNGNYLFLVNKKDSYLWELKLN